MKIKQNNKPYIYCNSIGYQEELVFDGQSFVINKNGEVVCTPLLIEEGNRNLLQKHLVLTHWLTSCGNHLP